jgi:hypothetical protein
MIARLFAFFIFAVSALPPVCAQNGGSILSRYGIGDLSGFLTARQRGLGGVATPLQSNQDINQLNPAAWTMIDGIRVQGDASYEFESYSKNSNLSIGSTNLSGFQFAIPVQDELRSRIVFGFLPYSRVGYKLESSATVLDDPYTTSYLGNGGLSMIRLGTALRPLSFLHVGVSAEYFFGSIDQEWDINFLTGTQFDTKQSRSTNYHGLGLTFGTQLAVGQDFLLGVSFEPRMTLTGTRDLFFQYITHDSTVSQASGELDLPLRLSVGATYFVTPQLMVGADMMMQDWGDARIFDAVQPEMGKAVRYAGAIEWQPGRNEFQAGFWRRAAYRLGVSFRELPVRLGGQVERETFLTAGIGIPIYQQNRADFAIEYGWRGTDASMLGTRSILRISMAVSVGESWFVRRGQD